MLKLNVGLSRKVGEPNYGSRGASVHLELEVESALASDPQTLQDRIRAMFRLARASVNEELIGAYDPASNGHAHSQAHSNGQVAGNGHTNGHSNGHRFEMPFSQDPDEATDRDAPRPRRLATTAQVRAIHAIANRRKLNLQHELRRRFNHGMVGQLSISEASQLIDAFKQMEQEADY